VYQLANLTSKSLYIFNGHEDVTADDLSCTVRFSDDASRRMDYVLSPLATAMLEGHICLFDEVAKSRPQALAALLSVCDERRYIDSTLLGERIYAAPGFRFIAATNRADLDGTFPEAIRSRLRPTVPVGPPPEAELNDLVKSRYEQRFTERVATHVEPLLERFWQLWRSHRPGAPPTPRDAIHIFGLALNLADQANPVATTQPIAGTAGLASLVTALEGAVDAYFSAEQQARR
jgi:MoxR-like ATPase